MAAPQVYLNIAHTPMAEQFHETIIAGKYRLLSVLGRGGMGEVYRAEQLDIEGQTLREVALKMIRPEHGSDPTFARRFLRDPLTQSAYGHRL